MVFAHESALVAHRRTHSGKKPYARDRSHSVPEKDVDSPEFFYRDGVPRFQFLRLMIGLLIRLFAK